MTNMQKYANYLVTLHKFISCEFLSFGCFCINCNIYVKYMLQLSPSINRIGLLRYHSIW